MKASTSLLNVTDFQLPPYKMKDFKLGDQVKIHKIQAIMISSTPTYPA